MRILRISLLSLGVLLAALLLGGFGLYLAAAGDYPVPATVTDDANLPQIEVQGVQLHAETRGDPANPTIIALHGGPGGDYAGLLPLAALDDRFHLVFYDQRGAGLSQRVGPEALTLDAYLGELDAVIARYSPDRPVILIGHSWGAMLASAYLAAHPDKVARAVLMEPGFLNAREFDAWQARAAGFMSGFGYIRAALWTGFQAAHVSGPDADAPGDFLIGRMADVFANHPDNPYHCPGQPYAAPSRRFGAQASRAARDVTPDDLARLAPAPPAAMPVLLLASACNDWIGPPLQQRHLVHFAHGKLVVIPDAGHAMLTDKPDATLDAIRTFLTE